MVVELSTVISLQGNQRKLKLRGNIGMKRQNAGESFGFSTQREGPNIDKDQIIFEARKTDNRRRPYVCVHQLKRYISD